VARAIVNISQIYRLSERLIGNQSLDLSLVRLRNQVGFPQLTQPLGGLFRKYVTPVSVTTLDFARCGSLEPFGGATIRFHFRHGYLCMFRNIRSAEFMLLGA
jgi:hypothetical protein